MNIDGYFWTGGLYTRIIKSSDSLSRGARERIWSRSWIGLERGPTVRWCVDPHASRNDAVVSRSCMCEYSARTSQKAAPWGASTKDTMHRVVAGMPHRIGSRR